MNPFLINTSFIQIRWYSVFIITGVVVSLIWMILEGKKFSLEKDFIINLLFWTMIFGIIGARIYYVMFNLEYYLEYPNEIYQIWNGGIAIHGGIIAGIITVIVYSKKYKVKSLKILDMLAPCLLFSQALGRWGNFFNSEAYGVQTTLAHLRNLHIPEFIINGMKIDGVYYTPTFLYESLWCMLGVILLIIIRKYKYTKIGYQAGFYMIWYSIGRFFIESLRTDSLMLSNMRVAQFVSIALFIIGFIIILVQSKKPTLEVMYNDYVKMEPKNFK